MEEFFCPCSNFLLYYIPDSCGGHTRMTERCNLEEIYAALTVRSPESKCSHSSCLPNLLSIHHVPAARTFFPHYPIIII